MKTISLQHLYNVQSEDDPQALKFLEDHETVRQAFLNGTLYARFIDGDRKGSIAAIIPDNRYSNVEPKRAELRRRDNWSHHSYYTIEHSYLFGLCKWTGRSNKPQITLPHPDVELLIDYDGPTIWSKFDAKAAKEEILKTPNQRDIDGNILAIGDRVLFINVRYGSRQTLDRGTVKEFKASVDSKGHSITTVIENDAGAMSELSYTKDMVLKISE